MDVANSHRRSTTLLNVRKLAAKQLRAIDRL